MRLKTEYDINERLFPTWGMKTIKLDNNVDELMRPIKILLQTLLESHSIIERYTQPTILKILNEGTNPLTIAPVSVERFILFADIISYSTITEKMPTADTLLILNTYFEICSRIILKRAGEVNKFMGDGLMAYFTIDQSDNVIHACIEILEALTRVIKRSLIISESLKNSTKEPWTFISLGKYNLRGKDIVTEVYSIDHALVNKIKGNVFDNS